MPDVFILIGEVTYEGSDIIGVYDTSAKAHGAKRRAQSFDKDGDKLLYYDRYHVEPWDFGEESPSLARTKK